MGREWGGERRKRLAGEADWGGDDDGGRHSRFLGRGSAPDSTGALGGTDDPCLVSGLREAGPRAAADAAAASSARTFGRGSAWWERGFSWPPPKRVVPRQVAAGPDGWRPPLFHWVSTTRGVVRGGPWARRAARGQLWLPSSPPKACCHMLARAFGPRSHPPPSHPLTWCLSHSELVPPTAAVADVWRGYHCWWRLFSFPRHHRRALLVRPPCGGCYCARPRAHAGRVAGVRMVPASPFAPSANKHQRITCWALLVSLCLSFAVPEEPPRPSHATVRW